MSFLPEVKWVYVALDFAKCGPDIANEINRANVTVLNQCLLEIVTSLRFFRCFVMLEMQEPDWKSELRLCDLYLQFDERNCENVVRIT